MRGNRFVRGFLAVCLVAWAGQSPAAAKTSFTEVVAPLLVERCGQCHIGRAAGGLSMATYATLLRGSANGRVLRRGNAEASRMVELIRDGKMPKQGDPLSETEVAAVAEWIDAGAKFDGPNPRAPLTAFARRPSPPATQTDDPMTPVADAVPFSTAVAPLLVEHCAKCHGGNQPRGGLSVANFESLTTGGDSGPLFAPSKPDESLLIAKLRGTADGARMPLDRDPLDEAQISLIARWIAAGAHFDAADPTRSLAEVVDIALARGMTHEQLRARRTQLAAHHWRLALPEVAPTTHEAGDLQLWGNVEPAELKSVGRMAQAEQAKVARILKPPRGEPFIRGGMTMFVYRRRFEYAEFGLMVEGRPFPPGQTAHWRHNVVDAYGCLSYSPDEVDTTLAPLLNRQLAGTHLASLPGVPMWFADGCSRVVVARCHPHDAQVRSWQQGVSRATAALGEPEEFLATRSFDGDSASVAYGFAESLMRDSRRFQRLLARLRAGDDFWQAFVQSYGADPLTVFNAWTGNAMARR